MTAQADLRSAIQAVNAGAYYDPEKPFGQRRRYPGHSPPQWKLSSRTENRTPRQEIRAVTRSKANAPVGRTRRLTVLRLAGDGGADRIHGAEQGESGTESESARHSRAVGARQAPSPMTRCAAGEPGERAFGHEGTVHRRVKDLGLFTAGRELSSWRLAETTSTVKLLAWPSSGSDPGRSYRVHSHRDAPARRHQLI
jgi:hypothetical protein